MKKILNLLMFRPRPLGDARIPLQNSVPTPPPAAWAAALNGNLSFLVRWGAKQKTTIVMYKKFVYLCVVCIFCIQFYFLFVCINMCIYKCLSIYVFQIWYVYMFENISCVCAFHMRQKGVRHSELNSSNDKFHFKIDVVYAYTLPFQQTKGPGLKTTTPT